MLERVNRVHFVGIGGIGMSGLARVLLQQGFGVSGSDARRSQTTRSLAELGARVFEGHCAAHVTGADLVVHTSAVGKENTEISAALAAGIPVMRRSQLLAEMLRSGRSIAVTGAHGKTTTSAMLVEILRAAKKPAGFFIGGVDNRTGVNAWLPPDTLKATQQPNRQATSGEVLLAVEADESDGSFLDLAPHHIVITNVDVEHMDYYSDLDTLVARLLEFGRRLPSGGRLFINRDDARLAAAFLAADDLTPVFYATQPHAGLWGRVDQEGRPTQFTLMRGDQPLVTCRLAIGGRHNVSNAVAAAAAAMEVGCAAEDVCQAVEDFAGVARRSQLKGEVGGVRIFDDYAHHPTEIAALLQTMRSETEKTLWAVFQPHRYSRFARLYDAFLESFAVADEVVVLPVYAAFESNNSEVTADRFAATLAQRFGKACTYVATLQEASQLIRAKSGAGDVVVTLGAGDVHRVGEMLTALSGGSQKTQGEVESSGKEVRL